MIDGSVALLATTTLPEGLPAAPGAKVTFSVADCPAGTTWPLEMPEPVNPVPETVTLEIVMLAVPAFVNVTGSVLFIVTVTVLKLRLFVLGLSAPITPLTVSVAVLLVALPAELLTVTLKCVPLLETLSTGVV